MASRLALWILGAYFLLLACYSKNFVYLHVSFGGFPLYISEGVFLAVIALRWRFWRRWSDLGRWGWSSLLLLGGYTFFRFLISWREGAVPAFGTAESIQQLGVTGLALWLLIPLLFTRRECMNLISCGLAGAALAQGLGWIGFLLMGAYGSTHSRLIGFPVGNEVAIALYPLAFLLWSPKWAFLASFAYGQLWLTQFLLYMKRAWVFSLIVFMAPVLVAPWRHGGRFRLKLWIASIVLGGTVAGAGVWVVYDRPAPILYHRAQKVEAAAQRENFGKVANSLLALLDNLYAYTDPLETEVSLARIVFKGDLATSAQGTSLMAFRVHLWRQAWRDFLERPWIGRGFGRPIAQTQLNGLPAFVNGKWISGAHNSFLTIINRLGIIGFALFTILQLSILWKVWERRLRLSSYDWILVSSLASVNFFAFFNVCLENPQGAVWYWFLLGMIAVPNEDTRATLSSTWT